MIPISCFLTLSYTTRTLPLKLVAHASSMIILSMMYVVRGDSYIWKGHGNPRPLLRLFINLKKERKK